MLEHVADSISEAASKPSAIGGKRGLTCRVSWAGMADEPTVLQAYTVLFWAKVLLEVQAFCTSYAFCTDSTPVPSTGTAAKACG